MIDKAPTERQLKLFSDMRNGLIPCSTLTYEQDLKGE